MQDFTWSLTANSSASQWAQTQWNSGLQSAVANQQPDFSGQPSFSDTLASLQTSDQESQNDSASETPAYLIAAPGAANFGPARPAPTQPAPAETAQTSSAPISPAKSPLAALPRNSGESSRAASDAQRDDSQSASTENPAQPQTASAPVASKTPGSLDREDSIRLGERITNGDSSEDSQAQAAQAEQQAATAAPLENALGGPLLASASKHAAAALPLAAVLKQPATAASASVSAEKPKGIKEALVSGKPVAPALNPAGNSVADSPAMPAGSLADGTPNSVSANLNSGLSQPLLTETADVSSLNQKSAVKSKNATAELAFAVKIQGNTAALASSASASTVTAMPVDTNDPAAASPFSLQLKSLLAEPKEGNAGPDNTSLGNKSGGEGAAVPALVLPGGAQNNLPADSYARTAQTASTGSIVSELPESASNGAAGVKTVQVQLTGADNQRVDLKLMERLGTLSISVRSADGGLTRALQQQLPELNGKLSDQDVRTEWWTPGGEKAEAAQSGKNSSNEGGGQSAASQDQGNSNKGSSGQQGGRSTREPGWVEDLVDLRKSNQNGAQYVWHL